MGSYLKMTQFYPYRQTQEDTEEMGDVEEVEEGAQSFVGILHIHVHYARNIHNICIYDNQDVYAKFSLTYNPDETLSTKIVKCGGKNPEFNETLQLKITQKEAVLKCEMWMQSRAKNYLEDQLLGFTLVPLTSLLGMDKLTQDFPLSSTDLFHSPAGTVRLTLMFNDGGRSFHTMVSSPVTSISSEVVLLECNSLEDIVDYNNIEFPDVETARENQEMVSEYFKIATNEEKDFMVPEENRGSFLHLGSPDYDMTTPNNEGLQNVQEAPFQFHNPSEGENSSHTGGGGAISSTTTSLSEEHNSQDSAENKKEYSHMSSTMKLHAPNGSSPPTPTSSNGVSSNGGVLSSNQCEVYSNKEDNKGKEEVGSSGEEKSSSSPDKPLISINFKPEETDMQQQIVDMYMKSMQQFTESLAKMKLPMDLENTKSSEDSAESAPKQKKVDNAKKDGSRIFYGSGAFF